MITENQIDAAAEYIGEWDSPAFEGLVLEFSEEQPVVLGYVFSDSFKLLTDGERDLLLYLILVMYQACSQNGGTQSATADALAEAEDRNWALLVDNNTRDFRRRLNPFFEGTSQEDLLAFFEDILLEDEDENLTPAGREHIFVAAKSVLDVWIEEK